MWQRLSFLVDLLSNNESQSVIMERIEMGNDDSRNSRKRLNQMLFSFSRFLCLSIHGCQDMGIKMSEDISAGRCAVVESNGAASHFRPVGVKLQHFAASIREREDTARCWRRLRALVQRQLCRNRKEVADVCAIYGRENSTSFHVIRILHLTRIRK